MMIIGSNMIYRENLTSTNQYLDDLLKSRDLQEGTIIYTNYQSEGRGQIGNKWESEDGNNLLLSVLLMPAMIEPSDQFILSIAVSLGICDFVRRYIPRCKIKWPNDIYVNDDKIAGILIENTLLDNQIEYSIVGIGVNINQDKFVSGAPNPVSLSMVTGEKYDLNNCLKLLAADLDYRYNQLEADRDQTKADYYTRLYRFNGTHRFRDQSGIFDGRIVAVSDSGRLQIEKGPQQIYEYSYKEIDFIL